MQLLFMPFIYCKGPYKKKQKNELFMIIQELQLLVVTEFQARFLPRVRTIIVLPIRSPVFPRQWRLKLDFSVQLRGQSSSIASAKSTGFLLECECANFLPSSQKYIDIFCSHLKLSIVDLKGVIYIVSDFSITDFLFNTNFNEAHFVHTDSQVLISNRIL